MKKKFCHIFTAFWHSGMKKALGNKRRRARVKQQNNPRPSVLKPNAFITSELPVSLLTEQTATVVASPPRQRRWTYSKRVPLRVQARNFFSLPISSLFPRLSASLTADASVSHRVQWDYGAQKLLIFFIKWLFSNGRYFSRALHYVCLYYIISEFVYDT